jgi:peptide/nickel transport system substrate-binding protein
MTDSRGQSSDHLENDGITRRRLIGSAGALGLGVAASPLLAACGAAPAGSRSSGKPTRGGTLVAGLTGGSSADTLDPNLFVSVFNAATLAQLYDPLVGQDREVRPYLNVAEEMTPNKDATVWTVRLRKGVTFHNGKEATAEDVIFSIKRARLGTTVIFLSGLTAMKKLDKYTVSLHFSHPYATFLEDLGSPLTVYLLPVGFDPKRPIGTGPFKYVSFTPGQQTVFARNENYWQRGLPYVDRLIFTNFESETTQVDALLGGTVDVVNSLSATSLGTVTGSGKQAVVSPAGGFTPFTMRVDLPPFNDVRVRQAFRLALDRPKMMESVFGGHGLLGNDIFGIWDPAYDHSIPQRHYDPEQAKSLLKAAGQSGVTVTLVTAPLAAGSVNEAQVFAQQATAAGITINLRVVTVSVAFGPNYLKWQFAQDANEACSYLCGVAQNTAPTASYNETHFDNPRYASLYRQALATPDANKRTEISHELQMIDYNEGGMIIPFFQSQIDGYLPKVHGIEKSKVGYPLNNFDLKGLWIA